MRGEHEPYSIAGPELGDVEYFNGYYSYICGQGEDIISDYLVFI